jgi:branched-chain amino acid transport system permease protein
MTVSPIIEEAANRSNARARRELAVIGLIAAVGMVLPAFLDGYWLRIATTVYMYAIVTHGLNVIVGFAGYHAFGNAVFFGAGAYAFGVAALLGYPVAVSTAAAVLVPVVMAAVLGWPILRLRGHYFAIATIALNLAGAELIIQIGGITGGANGLALPIPDADPQVIYRRIYWMMLAALIACTLWVWALQRHWLGTALRALKDNDAAAQVMGVDTVSARILAWMISAAMTGIAGGIWAYWITFLEPASAFDPLTSVMAYIMMIIGGMGTTFGPIIGALILQLVGAVVWAEFIDLHKLILGALIVVAALLMPDGIVQTLASLARAARGKR